MISHITTTDSYNFPPWVTCSFRSRRVFFFGFSSDESRQPNFNVRRRPSAAGLDTGSAIAPDLLSPEEELEPEVCFLARFQCGATIVLFFVCHRLLTLGSRVRAMTMQTYNKYTASHCRVCSPDRSWTMPARATATRRRARRARSPSLRFACTRCGAMMHACIQPSYECDVILI